MFRTLLAVALLTAIQEQTDTRTIELAPIKVVEGPLHIWRPAQTDAVAVQDEVRVAPADRLGTPKGQLAILMAGSGSMITLKGVRVGKDAGLSFEKVDSRLVMKVYDGKVAVDAFAAEFTVQTPQGSVEGGSSYFLIEVSDKSTKVVVLDGKLRFTDSQGGVTTVTGGEQIVVGTGKKASAPTRADPNEAAWAAPTTNLIKNGGFEEDKKGWEFYELPPKPNITILDRKNPNSGTRSLCMPVNPELAMSQDMAIFTQVVAPVVPKKRYLLRCYVRAEISKGRVRPGMIVEPVEEGAVTRSYVQCFPDTSDGTWKMARLFIVPKEAKLKISGSMQIVENEFLGKVWFDDFTLVELPEITPEKGR